MTTTALRPLARPPQVPAADVDPARLPAAAAVIKARRPPLATTLLPCLSSHLRPATSACSLPDPAFPPAPPQLAGAEVARNTGANVLGNPLTSLARAAPTRLLARARVAALRAAAMEKSHPDSPAALAPRRLGSQTR